MPKSYKSFALTNISICVWQQQKKDLRRILICYLISHSIKINSVIHQLTFYLLYHAYRSIKAAENLYKIGE